jgi:hypothetical protein
MQRYPTILASQIRDPSTFLESLAQTSLAQLNQDAAMRARMLCPGNQSRPKCFGCMYEISHMRLKNIKNYDYIFYFAQIRF